MLNEFQNCSFLKTTNSGTEFVSSETKYNVIVFSNFHFMKIHLYFILNANGTNLNLLNTIFYCISNFINEIHFGNYQFKFLEKKTSKFAASCKF